MRKILLSILGVFIIIGSFFAAKGIAGSRKSRKPKTAKVVKTVFAKVVHNGTVPIVVPANGNLTAKRRVELYAEVQGIFRAGPKLFRSGTPFNQGETIIRIDASEHLANVQSAKSDLYNKLTSIMPDMRLDHPSIYLKWEGYLNGFDMDKNVPELPEMTSDQEKYFVSGRGILTSYYNVKNLEQRLSKYRIAAPFKGIVTETLVTEGTLVRGGQKLGEFINTDVYELEVSISKTYSDLLKVGKKVVLRSLDTEADYQGRVVRINGNVDRATQTIKAFIEVRDKTLREGMYLEAKLQAKQESEAIEIDRTLLLENDRIFVVRNDSILDQISVRPVYFTDKKVVVKEIPDGTTIMTKPMIGAYTGMAIKVYQEKAPNSKGS